MKKTFLFHTDDRGKVYYFAPKIPYFILALGGKIMPARSAQRWIHLMDVCKRYDRRPSYFESVLYNMADNSKHV